MPLWGLLSIFLLVVICAVMTILYLDLRHKFANLEAKNRELAASQVLLMVPDDQAEALAAWLESHPQQTEQLLKRVETKANDGTKPSSATKADGPLKPDAAVPNQEALPDALVPEVISENDDGVKVIVLPHGGIRVTTREDKN